MIGLSRLVRAIADVPKGGMQTGTQKVTLKLSDAQRLKLEIEHLQSQNAELMSQVEVLREDKTELLVYALDAEKWFNKHDPSGYVSPKREEAQQHLREIRAEAGRLGYIEGAMNYDPDDDMDLGADYYANQYAENIRKGVK